LKILVDTNVLLDVVLNRKPFVENASLIWRLAEQKEITAYISNTSVTDIYYICRKHAGKEKARNFIADILDTFTLADIDESGFRQALSSDIDDFEDAVQYVIGTKANCKAFVTRNKEDFANKSDVLDPAEFISQLKAKLLP
jgi:predicted nucleic acid-binding protein